MKTVMLTDDLRKRIGDTEAVKMIAKAGFGGYDYSIIEMKNPQSELAGANYKAYVREIKKVADDVGLPCLQSHSLFYRASTKKEIEVLNDWHKRAIEIASYLGSPYIVIHPLNDFTAEQNYEYLYSVLLPFAKQAGIKIATENMYNYDGRNYITYPAACGTPEDFCKHIDIAKDEYLVGCLDIGHAEMPNAVGAPAMIRALGKERIKCLHVHDNNKYDDCHTTPFGRHCHINWQNVIDALKEIGYDGNFTFECGMIFGRYPDELLQSVCDHIAQIGDYFVKKLTE